MNAGGCGFDERRLVTLVKTPVARPSRRETRKQKLRRIIQETALRIVAGFERRSLRCVAVEVGCKKSALGNAASAIRRRLGIRSPGVSDETRRRLKEARRRVLQRKREQATTNGPLPQNPT